MADKIELALQTQIKNIEKATGKSFGEWLTIARTHGGKHGEMVKFLREKYGLTHGTANRIALKALEPVGATRQADADPADAWFTGNKAAMRPIYESVASAARALGNDVEFSPKKSYMSLRRNKQFACITPTTTTRVDVGLNLKKPKANKRLVAEKPGGMFNYRVAVSEAGQVDKELLNWLKQAYEEA